MSDAGYWNDRYGSAGFARTVGCAGDSRHYVEAYADWTEAVMPWLGRGRGVYDFGCGVGRWTPMLAGRYKTYVGYDASSSAVAEARRRYGDVAGVSFIDDCSYVPYYFDLIWSCTALQHVTDDKAFSFVMKCMADEIEGRNKVIMIENVDDSPSQSHIRKRSVDEYTSIMTGHGFTVQHVETVKHPRERHALMVFTR